MKKFYITTAIDYVNGSPHIGHAFEKVLADAIARWHYLKGENVFFLTGVDENAQKNVEAACKAGIPVKEFIDKNAGLFLKLCKKLNINYSKFIRTTELEHTKVVQEILEKIKNKGDIYPGKYKGLYCEGCEAFVTEKELVNGKCPEHKKEPIKICEEAYFFRLSKYKEQIEKFIKNVIPETRRKEILSRLKEPLKDLCITRKNAEWGVDFSSDFKVYVWVDALINYISGAEEKWPADLHVIGKGINWFHSVVWPALLLSAGYKLPKNLLVHGYLTNTGQKISKSLGNIINPLELAEKYSADAIRYALLRCSVFDDSDFSEQILTERNNNELANKLGNLISRTTALAEKYGIKKCENKLLKKIKIKKIEKNLDNYETDKALEKIFAFIDVCNEYIQNKKPWETHNKEVLYELADSIKAIAVLLYPFIPETAEKIADNFGFEIKLDVINKSLKEGRINKSEILFNKI